MKMFILFISMLIPGLSFGGLSESSVKSFNGRSGFVSLPARQVLFVSKTFSQEHTAGQKITLGVIPAGAKIIGVGVGGETFAGTLGDFTLGHLAATGYAEDLDLFISFTGGVTAPVSFIGTPYGKSFTEDITIVMAITQNTSGWNGETLNIWIDYLE